MTPKNKKPVVDPDLNYNDTLLEWYTPEFMPTPRGRLWYIIASIIVICLVAYAILTDSATMAVVFILLAGMFFMTHRRRPRIVDVKITKLGIEYDKTFHHYSAINAFWVVYHPPYVRSLYIRLGGATYRLIKIELNHQDPTKVRHLLSKEIPEIEGMEEHGFDIISRLLRLQ